MLAKHWRVVWDRPCDWSRGLANLLDSGHVPRGQQMPYQRLDHEVVKSVADKMRSKAAGADGWSGSEVADLPDEIWKFVVEIFTWLEEARSVPDTWKLSKQNHIPKTGMDPSLSHDCKNFRPITIMSIWYRIWGCSRLRSAVVQQWIRSWWPPEAVGGKRFGEIYDALIAFDDRIHKGEYLCSLDYSLAFDHTHPKMVTGLFREMGMHNKMVALIEDVWSHQRRFMYFEGVTMTKPELVQSSLPQGDAWSMIGMIATLIGPTKQITQQFPDITIFTFVDDRTFTSKRPDVLIDIHKLWSDWSDKLGLVENAEKTQLFHRTPAGRRSNLVKSGVKSSQVTDHPKILGNEVVGSQSRACSDSEEKRIRESCKQIKRVQWMPVSFKLKKLALQMGPLAKVSWGWFFKIPDQLLKKYRYPSPPVCAKLVLALRP